jgi:hypothetical protein
MYKVQKPSDSECYTPSSEPFTFYDTVTLYIALHGVKYGLSYQGMNTLMVFENRVLRIFGPKKKEVMGGWRKLHCKMLTICTLHQIQCNHEKQIWENAIIENIAGKIVVEKLEWKKNGIFWDVTPCGSCNNRRFGGT